MSKMKTDCKPPLAKSPTRLRPRRVLESNANCMQTPAGGSLRKPEKARRSGAWEMEEAELRPEYQSMSWEMRALATMVGDELGKEDLAHSSRGGGLGGNFSMSTNSSPLFERGRFYEEYSARRNERLNRKNKGCEANSMTAASASATKYNKYNDKLGITVESAKRSTCTRSTISSSKKLQSLRKSVSAAYSYSVETLTPAPAPPPTIITPSPTPRYMLRSLTNKENQKPPLPQGLHSHKSAIRGGRKIGAPRVGY